MIAVVVNMVLLSEVYINARIVAVELFAFLNICLFYVQTVALIYFFCFVLLLLLFVVFVVVVIVILVNTVDVDCLASLSLSFSMSYLILFCDVANVDDKD